MSATCQGVANKRQDICLSRFGALVKYLFSSDTQFISASFFKILSFLGNPSVILQTECLIILEKNYPIKLIPAWVWTSISSI